MGDHRETRRWGGDRLGLRLVLGAVIGSAGLAVAVPAGAVGGPEVTVAMSSTVGSSDVSNQPFFSPQVVQYNDLVSNPGASASGPVVVRNEIPGAGGVLDPGTVTCGSVPGCSAGIAGDTIVYALSSVPQGASALEMSFRVTIIPRRDISAVAKWTGGGCTRSCSSNRLQSAVVPSPLVLSSNPRNRAPVGDGQTIVYTLTMLPYGYAAGFPDITVTDRLPSGTTYEAGSASCGNTPDCRSGTSGGKVGFTLGAAAFASAAGATMTLSAVTTTAGVTLVNDATWTGGLCPAGTVCRPRAYIGLNAGGAPVVPAPPAPVSPVSAPPTGPTGAGSLELNPSSISPGGSTVVSGSGCPASTRVVIAIDGHQVAVTHSDAHGHFSTRVTPKNLGVGPHRVVATCGSVTLSATLNVVVTSTASTPESGGRLRCVHTARRPVGAWPVRHQRHASEETARCRRRPDRIARALPRLAPSRLPGVSRGTDAVGRLAGHAATKGTGDTVRVVMCGVRGSRPAPGPEFLRYGGNTSCVALAHDGEPPTLVLDAGSGLHRVASLLDGGPFVGSILLGHLHWDHTHGMPFFPAGDRPDARVKVYMPAQGDPLAVLSRIMSPPHFPITPDRLQGHWEFLSLEAGIHHIEGFTVLAAEVPHGGGRTFGYRVSDGHSSVTYISDHSPTALGPGPDGLGELHEAAVALARDTDVLIHDSQCTDDEIPARAYLGHAACGYAVRLADVAGANRLVLFHHDPARTDEEIDATLVQCRAMATLSDVDAADEGMIVDLPDTNRAQSLRATDVNSA